MPNKIIQREPHKLEDDEKAWLLIGIIDALVTLVVLGLYVWFTTHAA